MENQPREPEPAPSPAGSPSRPGAPDDSAFDLGRDPIAGAPPDSEEAWSAVGATRHLGDARSDDSTPAAGSAPAEGLPDVPAKKVAGTLGDFTFVKKLGEGAMGEVYKARQLSFNRDVALKVLFKHVANNPKLVERFYREARVAGRLDHPNVVRGYEVDECNGRHYFAMEYVSGRSLQHLLGRVGKFSVGDALYVVIRAAHGLQYIHQQGLVHRDIKPDNILVTRDGGVKVADLGMVKMLDEEMALTQTGHAVGTPWYMPLEQAKNSKETDGRCDIYALGCVLYALLTGKPPFHGPTLVEVIQAKEQGTFPPARQANAAVPERLDLILLKMTAKHVKNRYQSCAEVIRDLEGLDLTSEAISFLTPAGAKRTRPGSASEEVTPSAQTPLPGPGKKPSVDLWYVRFKSPSGQVVTRKLTTPQVLQLIEDEDFNTAARASRHPTEGFRALATYREFEATALGRVSKTGADRQTSRYRQKYKQIEEEDRQRALARTVEQAIGTGGYWLGIGLRAGAVAAAVGVVYLIFRVLTSQ